MSAVDLAIPTRRRADLRHLIQVLDNEGIHSWSVQAGIFGNMTGPELQALMDGGAISDDVVREIEWAMHRPEGWLDRHPEDAHDD
jgi:hypothetical protein